MSDSDIIITRGKKRQYKDDGKKNKHKYFSEGAEKKKKTY